MKNNLHPLQDKLWGEFRKKTGLKVIETEDFILTIHKIPKTKYTIGYLPKVSIPTKDMINKLVTIAKENNCIFIQIEPDAITSEQLKSKLKNLGLIPSFHPLLTKYNFILKIDDSEENLFKSFHSKTRYNIKLAQKKGVIVKEDNSQQAFEQYLKLTSETTKRQKFYAHSENYHRLMWETLKANSSKNHQNLSAHLLIAKYQNEIIVAWILFVLGDKLYYPYGSSSTKYKEVMASNLMMWEAIRFGKKLGLKKFDLWGSLGPNPDPKDPWFGFHRFKNGYNPQLVEYVGSYDLVVNKKLYFVYKILDKLRWAYLKFK